MSNVEDTMLRTNALSAQDHKNHDYYIESKTVILLNVELKPML